MKRSGILISALVLLAAPANAADLYSAPSSNNSLYSAASVSNWSGFYAGVNGGYAWGTTINSPALPSGSTDNNSSGWSLGGQAGFNADMGGFVLGGEGDLQWANAGYTTSLPGSRTFDSKVDVFGTLRARAGVPVGQVMPYVTAGLALGRGTAALTDDTTKVTTSQSAAHFGWTAGVGLEAQATTNVTFKAEYLYVDLGQQAYNGLPVGNREITQRFSVIRAGVNYKF